MIRISFLVVPHRANEKPSPPSRWILRLFSLFGPGNCRNERSTTLEITRLAGSLLLVVAGVGIKTGPDHLFRSAVCSRYPVGAPCLVQSTYPAQQTKPPPNCVAFVQRLLGWVCTTTVQSHPPTRFDSASRTSKMGLHSTRHVRLAVTTDDVHSATDF